VFICIVLSVLQLTTSDYPFDTFKLFFLKASIIDAYINAREYRRGNQNWTIQRNWQHRVHKTKTTKAKTQHNMCWTALYASIGSPYTFGPGGQYFRFHYKYQMTDSDSTFYYSLTTYNYKQVFT